MSADIFPNIMSSTSKPKDSRIPVPSSPIPLRRSSSLRLSSNQTPSSGTLRSAPLAHSTPQRDKPTPLLKRGNSFMERGERHSKYGAPAKPRNNDPSTKPKTLSNRLATTPQSPSRLRSLSLSLSSTRLNVPTRSPASSTQISPKTPPTSPDNIRNYSSSSNCHLDWDNESVNSLTSVTSVASCDHASVARNGTTFSGRSMKYVFHCNQHAGATGEDYLTPTQRVHRQVKKLKYLLHQAKRDLEDKDSDILKLTKEVVELRLYKAALNSPEDKSNSSDAVTVRENNTDEQITPEDLLDGISSAVAQNDMTSSYTDSGHFDDFANSPTISAKLDARPVERAEVADKEVTAALGDSREHSDLILEYEKRLQELVKHHEEESYQLKQKHNDKVEELLQRITEINKRYWELVPELDSAKEKIKELEAQLEEACLKLEQQETAQKETYLDMYKQGHAAAQQERENRVMEIVKQGPSRISVPELLEELQVTKNELENIKAMYRQLMEAKNKSKIDPEITLQFLRSAIYYFLTDKDNCQGHLRAIQSILGFTPNEISNIDKARLS